MTGAWKRRILLASSILLVTVVVARGIGKGEFDYNVDESQHAATGLFVSSLLKDFPIRHPVAYTYLYYAQYPALSGVIHWPPIFYAVEGALFALLGPSVVTARLAVLLFALLGWFFWFRLVSEILGDWAAVFSTIILALLPYVLLFEKTVMLEIPCLALCVVALYYWYRYLTGERQVDLYLFAVFSAVALLTKQNALFLLPVCILSTALLKKWKLVLDRRVLSPLAIVVALVGPFYALVYLVHWKTIAMDLVGPETALASHPGLTERVPALLFYVKALPEQLGWPLLALVVAGILSRRLWSKREPAMFMLAWVASCYLTFTLISHKEARYSFYWLPPLLYFVAGLLTMKWRFRPARVLAGALAAVLVFHFVAAGWNYRRPYVEGYASLASQLRRQSNSGVILFDAALPANFIFFLRKLDSQRQFVVLRKSLWTARLKLSGGSEELARTADEVKNVIDQNGVKYLIVSDTPVHFEGQRNLRRLLAVSPQFKLLATCPIESNQWQWQNHHLYLYENTQGHAPADRFLKVRMMTLRNDLVVPWDDLLQIGLHAQAAAFVHTRSR